MHYAAKSLMSIHKMLFPLFCLWWMIAKEFKSHPRSNCPSVTKSLLSTWVCSCWQNICSMPGVLGIGYKGIRETFIMFSNTKHCLVGTYCGNFYFSWTLRVIGWIFTPELGSWEKWERHPYMRMKVIWDTNFQRLLSPNKIRDQKAKPNEMSSSGQRSISCVTSLCDWTKRVVKLRAKNG